MSEHTFAICVNNQDYEVSLEYRKLYEVLTDPDAEKMGQVRIIDESGEDYLYPKEFFFIIDLPEIVEKQIIHTDI